MEGQGGVRGGRGCGTEEGCGDSGEGGRCVATSVGSRAWRGARCGVPALLPNAKAQASRLRTRAGRIGAKVKG